ncbi:hypothetical protein AB0D66_21900 [Streptomyces sp. NPDC048270]|uniref:hypothetical protein n=1 Tax=Streptomyces sp. NPDC048270 TaxID=3154615 RepID=UPI0033CCD954
MPSRPRPEVRTQDSARPPEGTRGGSEEPWRDVAGTIDFLAVAGWDEDASLLLHPALEQYGSFSAVDAERVRRLEAA